MERERKVMLFLSSQSIKTEIQEKRDGSKKLRYKIERERRRKKYVRIQGL